MGNYNNTFNFNNTTKGIRFIQNLHIVWLWPMIINSNANAANACVVLQQGRYVVITASSAFKETSVPSSLCRAPMSSMTVGGHASYLTVIRERRVVVAAVEFGYRYRALIASPRNLGKLYDRNLRSYVVFL